MALPQLQIKTVSTLAGNGPKWWVFSGGFSGFPLGMAFDSLEANTGTEDREEGRTPQGERSLHTEGPPAAAPFTGKGPL